MADGSGNILSAARKRVVVLFAGGGGSSIAIMQALGIEPDAGLNHWPLAGQVHEVNFPGSEFHCADISETDPDDVCPGEPLGFVWLSPDCRHFSPAKGGALVSEQIRSLAWVAIPWAKKRRPDVIMLENVKEFLTWGPVGDDGRPIKQLAGTTFAKWRAELEALGYVMEHKVLSAADYGAPTIRRRLFIVMRCDGKPIVWPRATHGPRDSEAVRTGLLKAHLPAADIIDWSRRCYSIFMDSAQAKSLGLKRPLVSATEGRIAKGLYRHTIKEADPFIIKITDRVFDRDNAHDLRKPLRTMTTSKGGEFALVAAGLVKHNHGSHPFQTLRQPLHTVTAQGNKFGQVQAAIAPIMTGCGGRMAQTEPVDPRGPYPTVTAKNDSALAAVHLEQFNTHDAGRSIAKPLPTMTVKERHGVVTAFMEQANTGMVGHDARSPVSTIVGRGTTQRLAIAHLSHMRGSGPGTGDLHSPAKSPTASGTHQALVETEVRAASVCSYYGTLNVSGADEPLPTATAKPRFGLTEATLADLNAARVPGLAEFLEHHFGAVTETDLADPLATADSRARLGLVLAPDGNGGEIVYQIVDIGMRMLDAETELAAAMGVPPDYILGRDTAGRSIPKTAITKMVGNMVSPPPARALIEANLSYDELLVSP